MSLEPMYEFHSKRNNEIMQEAKEKYRAKFNELTPEVAQRARENCQVLYEKYLSQGGEMAKKSMDLLDEIIKK
jgi:hypothetical protein